MLSSDGYCHDYCLPVSKTMLLFGDFFFKSQPIIPKEDYFPPAAHSAIHMDVAGVLSYLNWTPGLRCYFSGTSLVALPPSQRAEGGTSPRMGMPSSSHHQRIPARLRPED